METFIVKLSVALLPLVTLILSVNLSDYRFRRQAQVVCRGRRARDAMYRALAVGIFLR